MKRPVLFIFGLQQVGKLPSALARGRFLSIYSIVVAMLLLTHIIPGASEVLAQTVYTFSAIADARVLASNPDTNYGTISRLDVDRPGQESYIRFTVSGITDVVQSAKLRLFVTNGSVNGPLLYGTDNNWTETGITWNKRPSITTSVIADIGSIKAGYWAEYNVTAYITGNSTYSFVLFPDSTDGIRFYSREGTSKPELVLTLSSDTTPTPTNLPLPTPTPSITQTNTPVLPTATYTPTRTSTNLPTDTLPSTPTSSSPLPTTTPTYTHTNTPIPKTATPTYTSSYTPLPSSATPTFTQTNKPPVTATHTNTPTSSPTPSLPNPTNTPVGTAITFAPVADARVLESYPDTNYGTLSRLYVDSPGEQSYIRFSVNGVIGVVHRAIMRFYVTNGSSNGPSLYGTNNTWSETEITWNNRPAATTGVIANSGTILSGTWVEYDVSPVVTRNGTYSFVFLPNSTDGVTYYSRESSSPPQLELSFTSELTPTPTRTPIADSIVFVGAGDIADCNRDQDEATAKLLDNIPGTVFTLGDNAYPNGTILDYECFETTWGRHKTRIFPAVGDNEYSISSVAEGYFNYFGAAAGDPSTGYYSYDIAGWHIIVLNSNCSKVGGCGLNSPQGQWLQVDLTANPSACTLAIVHEPLFSSSGGDLDMRDLWVPLYQAGTDIVLSGHRHNFERFAPQNPDGVADPGRGIRLFVVGTGGSDLSSFDTIAPNSEIRNNSTYGVLKLTLHPTGYAWDFIPIANQTFTDSGSAQCVTP